MAVKRFESVREEQFREDSQGTREYEQQYLVELDSPVDSVSQCKAHRPDLVRGQGHPDDPSCFVQQYILNRRKHSLIYDLTINWSNSLEATTSPLVRPPDIRIKSLKVMRDVITDGEGRPIVNTAGTIIEGKKRAKTMLVIEVRKNVAAVPGFIQTYPDSVNSDTVRVEGLTCRPETLLFDDFEISEWDSEGDYKFRVFQWQMTYNDETWREYDLNRGVEEVDVTIHRYKEKEEEKQRVVYFRTQCLDSWGKPLEEPQFLNREGRRPREYLDEAGDYRPSSLALKARKLAAGESFTEFLKFPLTRDDIVIVESQPHIKRPFRVLPIR